MPVELDASRPPSARGRPRSGVGVRKLVRNASAHLAASTGDEISHAIVLRMLEIVFVAAEAGADPTSLQHGHDVLHAHGVVVCGPAQKAGWCENGIRHRTPSDPAGGKADRMNAWCFGCLNSRSENSASFDVSRQTNSTSLATRNL